MLGDASCRLLVNVLGYLWPAYYTFKAVEAKHERVIERWCVYWLILAVFSTAERLILDWTVFWLPLYYEGKILFVIWLWHSQTNGAQYLYRTFLSPLLSKYEPIIDNTIAETQTWVLDNFWQYARRAIQVVQSNAHLAIGQFQSKKDGHRPQPRKPSLPSELDLPPSGMTSPQAHTRKPSGNDSAYYRRSSDSSPRKPGPEASPTRARYGSQSPNRRFD